MNLYFLRYNPADKQTHAYRAVGYSIKADLAIACKRDLSHTYRIVDARCIQKVLGTLPKDHCSILWPLPFPGEQ